MIRHRVHCRPCGPVACSLGQGRAVVLVVERRAARPPSRRAMARGHLLRWAAVLAGCLAIGGGC